LGEVRSFRDLIVWQRGIELTLAIYGLTKTFPKEEMFGLTTQLRRAAVSIPSNIAEGHGRGSRGEYRQFVGVARGSNFEVQTQLVLVRGLGFGDEKTVTRCEELSGEVGRMLNSLIASLKVVGSEHLGIEGEMRQV